MKLRKSKLDNFDQDVVKRCILNMFRSKELVTLRKLKSQLQVSHDIDISKQTLWKTVRKIGFTYKKNASGRNVLCETVDLVIKRCKYLRKVAKMRREGYDIVYQDESWINANHTNEKEWVSIDGEHKRQVAKVKD